MKLSRSLANPDHFHLTVTESELNNLSTIFNRFFCMKLKNYSWVIAASNEDHQIFGIKIEQLNKVNCRSLFINKSENKKGSILESMMFASSCFIPSKLDFNYNDLMKMVTITHENGVKGKSLQKSISKVLKEIVKPKLEVEVELVFEEVVCPECLAKADKSKPFFFLIPTPLIRVKPIVPCTLNCVNDRIKQLKRDKNGAIYLKKKVQ